MIHIEKTPSIRDLFLTLPLRCPATTALTHRLLISDNALNIRDPRRLQSLEVKRQNWKKHQLAELEESGRFSVTLRSGMSTVWSWRCSAGEILHARSPRSLLASGFSNLGLYRVP